jgi:hypothetical protein
MKRFLLCIVSFGGLVAAAWGCNPGIQSKVSCMTDNECVMATGTLLAPDASSGEEPQCCAGICAIPSFGCDSGYRYLTVDPNNAPHGGFGDCIPAPTMCPLPADMSVVPDMSTPPPANVPG